MNIIAAENKKLEKQFCQKIKKKKLWAHQHKSMHTNRLYKKICCKQNRQYWNIFWGERWCCQF